MTTRTLAGLLACLCLAACNGDVSEASGTDSATEASSGETLGTGPTTTIADTTGTDSMGSLSNSGGSSESSSTGADTSGGSSSEGSSSESTSSDTGTPMPCSEDADCDDLLPCNGVETCVDDMCSAGIPIVCDDGVPCTLDACNDENGGTCVAAPDDAACDDGLFCNGIENCDPMMDCQAGEPIACDDGVGCTDDACDEETDACGFAPDHESCQDGEYCNGPESCDVVLGCIDGDAIDCNDLVACTVDACNESLDTCDHTPDDAPCGNGVFCDGEEQCDEQLGCVDGPAVMCPSDGVACTVDACDEDTNACESTPNNMACGNGQFCTEDGCIAGASCSVLDGVLNNPSCDDGLGCNGEEVCFDLPGNIDQCQPGTAVDCADGISCTSDSCVEPGVCENAPVDGLCSDGNPCDGAETCNPAVGCQDGPDLDCNDGIPCTQDSCIMNFGCNNVAADEQCDDGVYCNGAEFCDIDLGCQDAPPIVCPSDGIACTAEVCNEDFDVCLVVPNDDLCACGESCEPQNGGCSDACSPASCDGHVYQCGNCLDDDLDCDIDDEDSNCFGPCSNNEDGLDGGIPGQNNSPCKHDCYFDNNTGSGDDDCFWSHECDPLEPSATTCEYDPDANVPGTNDSCQELEQTQSAECNEVCGELTPNGCDCFGCCTVLLPGIGLTNVFLGSAVDGDGDPTCSIEVFDAPNVLELCHECTQVPACLNTCEDCELCFGQEDLPPECDGMQVCEAGTPCGLPGQPDCPNGEFCLTGCCVQG
jgi:hypothetical protein